MPLTSKVNIPYDMKATVVKVYSYENKNLKGVLLNSYFEAEQKFESTMDMLLVMETIFDNTLPQNSFENRSFGKTWSKQGSASDSALDIEADKVIATFNVRVIFRQNASWQGVISRPDKGDDANFRSALEMLFLIDSALCE